MNRSEHTNLSQLIIQVAVERKPQTVRQLAAFVKERVAIPEEEILTEILSLQNQGKIRLADITLPSSTRLTTYVKTSHALWYWASTITAIMTTIIVFTIPNDSYPLNLVRIVLGIVFVLWLPGYSLVRMLYPRHLPIRTGTRNLDAIARIALSLGMSLAIVPLVGLVLNFTPWGIRLAPIVLSLLALTLIFTTVAVGREFRLWTNRENPKT